MSQYPISSHIQSPDFMKNVVVHGNTLHVLKHIPDSTFHLTFTSPPYYNARDYSIYPNYQYYLDFLGQVFFDIARVTKEGRFFILNTSPIIMPRPSRSGSSQRFAIPFDLHPCIIDAGWEFIDDIIWVKPSGSSKNRAAGFTQNRKPLTYKTNPRVEYLMVYRKKTDHLIDWNLQQYTADIVNASLIKDDFEKTNLWHISPTNHKTHSAVFPIELCTRIIKYYSFKGDLVFDPFGGSGTFGKAAMLSSRYFFMTEINEQYIHLMQHEINNTLWNDKPIQFMKSNELEKIVKLNSK